MSVLTIPTERTADIARAKDFLFAVYGERRWTEAEYLELSASSNQPIELSEGRLVVLEMPTPRHQDIVWNIGEVLKAWARKHGGRSFVAPLPVRLWPGRFREPDVLLYSAEHQDRVGEQHGGPPDLAVEVLSPGTTENDTDDKMIEYALAGIPEYWIVDPKTSRVAQYLLEGERYHLHARYGAGETVRSVTFPDLEAAVEAVFAGG